MFLSFSFINFVGLKFHVFWRVILTLNLISLLNLEHVELLDSCESCWFFLFEQFPSTVLGLFPLRIELEGDSQRETSKAWFSSFCHLSVSFSGPPFYLLLASCVDKAGTKLSLGVRGTLTWVSHMHVLHWEVKPDTREFRNCLFSVHSAARMQ